MIRNYIQELYSFCSVRQKWISDRKAINYSEEKSRNNLRNELIYYYYMYVSVWQCLAQPLANVFNASQCQHRSHQWNNRLIYGLISLIKICLMTTFDMKIYNNLYQHLLRLALTLNLDIQYLNLWISISTILLWILKN